MGTISRRSSPWEGGRKVREDVAGDSQCSQKRGQWSVTYIVFKMFPQGCFRSQTPDRNTDTCFWERQTDMLYQTQESYQLHPVLLPGNRTHLDESGSCYPELSQDCREMNLKSSKETIQSRSYDPGCTIEPLETPGNAQTSPKSIKSGISAQAHDMGV